MNDYSFLNSEELKEKTEKIKKLEQKLNETEKKLNELNKNLEQKVIDITVEVNKLINQKSMFINNLSHDLATPLTPLMTLLPIIKEEVKNPEIKEMVEICIRNVEYIKRVVNNTRELGEIISTNLFLKKESLFDIVNEIHKKYEAVFKSCNIKVFNNIDNNVYVKTEKKKLIQVFDHIISNAVNSMINKGGTLTFESKHVMIKSEPFVQISVKDTGIGLMKEQVNRIFDDFYKTDESRHKLDSTGLGLTICKSIIEKHNGKIWADSHGIGTGTTIFFTIPSSEIVFDRTFL
ncbi:MAG: sensor histidine kinase [Thermoplasmatota archaeon]